MRDQKEKQCRDRGNRQDGPTRVLAGGEGRGEESGGEGEENPCRRIGNASSGFPGEVPVDDIA